MRSPRGCRLALRTRSRGATWDGGSLGYIVYFLPRLEYRGASAQNSQPCHPNFSPPSDLPSWPRSLEVDFSRSGFPVISFTSPDSLLLLFRFASFSSESEQTNIYRRFRFSFLKLLLPTLLLVALSHSLSRHGQRRRRPRHAAPRRGSPLRCLLPAIRKRLTKP